jgi:hypothetical protein
VNERLFSLDGITKAMDNMASHAANLRIKEAMAPSTRTSSANSPTGRGFTQEDDDIFYQVKQAAQAYA